MQVVVTGGGTAGHINPALALIEELESRGVTCVFAGTPHGREADLVPDAHVPFKAFDASGFNRNHPTTIFKALSLMKKSTRAAMSWFEEIMPDAVVGFGGYVSMAVCRAAQKRRVPYAIHEQNSVMGLANNHLSKHAHAVCLTYAAAAPRTIDPSVIHLTGNPVRRSIFDATRDDGRKLFNIPDDALMLLVTGGSLGARHINTALIGLKESLLEHDELYIVHITGPAEYDQVVHDLDLNDDEKKRWQVLGYTNAMGEAMAASDMIVSRAGASSLAEIAARAIPALLVPFPYATEDHQTANARSAVEGGYAYMVPDAKVETADFSNLLMDMISNKDLRTSMHASALKQDASNAAARLADIVINLRAQ